MKDIYSSITKLLVSIFILQFIITSANAQWSTQSNVNNPVNVLDAAYGNSSTVSDGSGGAIITWVDSRSFANSQYDIYVQRIDANGTLLWATDGVAVCTAANSQLTPVITSDGSGGAIITWRDDRNIANTSNDIYAQRIDASGVVKWATDGVAISTADLGQYRPVIVSDGSGGAIIAWMDGRGGYDIYVQQINESGIVQWTTNGVLLTSTEWLHDQQYPTIASDSSGGAIIAWVETLNNGAARDIFAQHIDSNGDIQWTPNGIAICTAVNGQGGDSYALTSISDGIGGAIITWLDARSGLRNDIYAQRINSLGVIQWTADGVAICTQAFQSAINMCSDGSSGGIITWVDNRNNAITSYDIYAQRVDGNGDIQWTIDGEAVCTAGGTQGGSPPPIVSDGSGGAIISWDDSRAPSNANIYAQRINSSGIIQWPTNGAIISNATNSQRYPVANSNENGGAIISWLDFRTGAGGIYAQNVNFNGTLGNLTTGVVEQAEGIHNLFLSQNYPNPFKQSTKISYETGTRQLVLLEVSDLSGKVIKTLVNEEQPAGSYEIDFDGSNMVSGTYIIELQAGLRRETKKMILMK